MVEKRKLGVVLFQLGGPDSPDAVEPFLYNLFCDPDIIDFFGAWFARRPLARYIARKRAGVVGVAGTGEQAGVHRIPVGLEPFGEGPAPGDPVGPVQGADARPGWQRQARGTTGASHGQEPPMFSVSAGRCR